MKYRTIVAGEFRVGDRVIWRESISEKDFPATVHRLTAVNVTIELDQRFPSGEKDYRSVRRKSLRAEVAP